MTAVYAIIALVALQRVAELVYSEGNTRRLRERGAVEVGQAHYPFIIALHAAWLSTIAYLAPKDGHIVVAWLVLVVILQAARIWVVATLGPYWTTRIITLPGAPLVRKGPYRFVRHPNYLVVIGEIAALPLAFGQWRVALMFSMLNAAMLAWRISAEDRALATRRAAA